MNSSTEKLDLEWPFPGRRYPTRDDPDYLGSKGLSLALRKVIEQELTGKLDLDILDVGCGEKPFYPFFRPYSKTYVGTDITKSSPQVDIVCPVEALATEDESADVVICLSVLEHVDDPVKAVRELYRAVRPDGVVFASTHGCFPWHPHPQDHWRWTQTGLPSSRTTVASARCNSLPLGAQCRESFPAGSLLAVVGQRATLAQTT